MRSRRRDRRRRRIDPNATKSQVRRFMDRIAGRQGGVDSVPTVPPRPLDRTTPGNAKPRHSLAGASVLGDLPFDRSPAFRIPRSARKGGLRTRAAVAEEDEADPGADIQQGRVRPRTATCASPPGGTGRRRAHPWRGSREPAPPLIQVVRAPEQGAGGYRRDRRPRSCCSLVIRYPRTITSSTIAAWEALSTSAGPVHQ